MVKMIFSFFLFLPSFFYGASVEDPYSDVLDPGLHVFLTEHFKIVKNIQRLPANLKTQMEQYRSHDLDSQYNDEFTETDHFKRFKMDLAGTTNKYFFICYQTGGGRFTAWCHLVVFIKGEKNEICFKKQIPEPNYYDHDLEKLRSLVVGYYRTEQKREKAKAEWEGDSGKGWVNLKTKMHLKISGDGKALIASNGFGYVFWKTDVSDLWAHQSEEFYPEKFYPRRVARVDFDEGLIYVYWGKCSGSIETGTGGFTYDGCL